MVLVEGKPRAIYSYSGGYALAKVDLQVSTVAELPSLGDVIEGTNLKCGKGSNAQIIQADEPTYLTLDADGTWYPEQS